MGIARALPSEGLGAPEGFERVALPQGVRISWRGAGSGACLWAGVLGLALCALLVIISAALGFHDGRSLALVAAVLVTGSAYLLLVGALNRTVVSLREHSLTVAQRPLPCPWPAWMLGEKNCKLSSLDIYQVWVEEQPPLDGRNGDEPSYDLSVLTIDAGRKQLLTRLSADQAAYLVEELRVQLGLER